MGEPPCFPSANTGKETFTSSVRYSYRYCASKWALFHLKSQGDSFKCILLYDVNESTKNRV